jgi:hypothetical protein
MQWAFGWLPRPTARSAAARETVAALDRLRSEMDCHLQVTRPCGAIRGADAAQVYGGLTRFSGCGTNAEEREKDDFAGWELEE